MNDKLKKESFSEFFDNIADDDFSEFEDLEDIETELEGLGDVEGSIKKSFKESQELDEVAAGSIVTEIMLDNNDTVGEGFADIKEKGEQLQLDKSVFAESAYAAEDDAGDFPFGGEKFVFPAQSFQGFADDDEPTRLDETLFGEIFDSAPEEDVPDVGFSWMSVIWGILLVASIASFLVDQYLTSNERQKFAAFLGTALELKSDSKDLTNQSLLAFGGSEEAYGELPGLIQQVNGNITELSSLTEGGAGHEVSAQSRGILSLISEIWPALRGQIEILLASRGVISSMFSHVSSVNKITPDLLEKTDVLVNKLIANEASLELINHGSRQRFLSQRIKASANEFAMGGDGWQQALDRLSEDVETFGSSNEIIRSMGGVTVAPDVDVINESYRQLVFSTDSLGDVADDFGAVQQAKQAITANSDELLADVSTLIEGLGGTMGLHLGSVRAGWREHLPSLLGGLVILSIIGLIWSLIRQSMRRENVNALRTKQAEGAVIKLLDEMGDLAQGDLTVEAEVTNEVTGAIADSVNFAIGEMRVLVKGIKSASNEMANVTEDSEQLIAQLLTSNDAQSEEILSAAQEIENMSDTMSGMSQSALNSSEQAKETAESAKKGATAVRNTILGMNTSRNQIQDTSKRLKRLGESSQQINEIVNLIKDVTEQTNVLSLNASIQAAMAGEAGRGFAVVAEEVQRLADRSARASSEITDLVKNIQQDANRAIVSMEATTQEVITGATMADEAGQALDEIEKISQNLYETIEKVASEATEESNAAGRISERMNTLKAATEESDLSVSQVAAALSQIRDVAGKLDKSVAGFRLPV